MKKRYFAVVAAAMIFSNFSYAQTLDGLWTSDNGHQFRFETKSGVTRMIAENNLRQPEHSDMQRGDVLAEGILLGPRFVGRSMNYNHLKSVRQCSKEERDMNATIDFRIRPDNTLEGFEVFDDMTGVQCNERKTLKRFGARRRQPD